MTIAIPANPIILLRDLIEEYAKAKAATIIHRQDNPEILALFEENEKAAGERLETQITKLPRY